MEQKQPTATDLPEMPRSDAIGLATISAEIQPFRRAFCSRQRIRAGLSLVELWLFFPIPQPANRRTLMRAHVRGVAVLAGLLALIGCSGSVATVKGRVTCQGNPVKGSILFSPKGEDANNTGPAVPAQLKDDGSFELKLTTIGKHAVTVTPSDVKYPVKPGEMDYPCDRSPQEREIKAGSNEIIIELTPRKG
jgi:hypothetical protein